MHYYSFHIGDYRGATSHLSNDEDLAYRRLIDMYYDSEKPIPVDTQWVSRRLRLGSEVVINVLNDFFFLLDDGWHHSRCDYEIEEYRKLADKNRENGKKGGRPKGKNNPLGSQSVPSGNPNESACKGNHKPLTDKPLTDKPLTDKPLTDLIIGETDAFNLFWAEYPNKTAKQAAIKAWQKLKPSDSLFNLMMAALKKQKPYFKIGFIPHPATWLNGRRWEDDIQPAEQSVRRTPAADNFAGKDYQKGINDDGSF